MWGSRLVDECGGVNWGSMRYGALVARCRGPLHTVGMSWAYLPLPNVWARTAAHCGAYGKRWNGMLPLRPCGERGKSTPPNVSFTPVASAVRTNVFALRHSGVALGTKIGLKHPDHGHALPEANLHARTRPSANRQNLCMDVALTSTCTPAPGPRPQGANESEHISTCLVGQVQRAGTLPSTRCHVHIRRLSWLGQGAAGSAGRTQSVSHVATKQNSKHRRQVPCTTSKPNNNTTAAQLPQHSTCHPPQSSYFLPATFHTSTLHRAVVTAGGMACRRLLIGPPLAGTWTHARHDSTHDRTTVPLVGLPER